MVCKKCEKVCARPAIPTTPDTHARSRSIPLENNQTRHHGPLPSLILQDPYDRREQAPLLEKGRPGITIRQRREEVLGLSEQGTAGGRDQVSEVRV